MSQPVIVIAGSIAIRAVSAPTDQATRRYRCPGFSEVTGIPDGGLRRRLTGRRLYASCHDPALALSGWRSCDLSSVTAVVRRRDRRCSVRVDAPADQVLCCRGAPSSTVEQRILNPQVGWFESPGAHKVDGSSAMKLATYPRSTQGQEPRVPRPRVASLQPDTGPEPGSGDGQRRQRSNSVG